MDPFKNWQLVEIIRLLKPALNLAESAISQDTDIEENDEPTDIAPVELLNNTPMYKRNAQENLKHQYGIVNLPIHYTLGSGVLEALGDDVDEALFMAFRGVSRDGDFYRLNYCEYDFQNVGLATEMLWDKYGRCGYLHLELVHTDDAIYRNGDGMDELPDLPLH